MQVSRYGTALRSAAEPPPVEPREELRRLRPANARVRAAYDAHAHRPPVGFAVLPPKVRIVSRGGGEDSTVSLTDDPDDDADPEWLQVGGVVPLSEAASKATRAHRRAALLVPRERHAARRGQAVRRAARRAAEDQPAVLPGPVDDIEAARADGARAARGARDARERRVSSSLPTTEYRTVVSRQYAVARTYC